MLNFHAVAPHGVRVDLFHRARPRRVDLGARIRLDVHAVMGAPVAQGQGLDQFPGTVGVHDFTRYRQTVHHGGGGRALAGGGTALAAALLFRAATAGGGAVYAKVSGAKELKELKLKPDVVDPEDIEMLEDLVLTCVNEALKKVDEAQAQELGKYNIPGLGF